jgi:hypothetical protein
MITPKTIPLIASIVQGDFGEARADNGVATVVARKWVFVEFIAIHRRASRVTASLKMIGPF